MRQNDATIILELASNAPAPRHCRRWFGMFFASQQSLPREQDPVSVITLHGLSFPFSFAFALILFTAFVRFSDYWGFSRRSIAGIRSGRISLP
eukprot:3342094-Pyramimonas_sp.AAC.1